MNRRARWMTLGLVVGGAACGDIAAPRRNDFYEWRLIVTSASGVGADSLSFHWPRERLPIRIWAEDGAGLPENLPKAIEAWRAAFLYREFDATVVADSSTADVIFRATGAPGTQFSRVRVHSALAPECAGATDLDVSDDHTQLRLPVRVFIDPRSDPNAPNLGPCLALTTTHELGHVLGIWQHSDVATDLMFADPSVSGPSAADLATAEMLYHQPANVEAVGP